MVTIMLMCMAIEENITRKEKSKTLLRNKHGFLLDGILYQPGDTYVRTLRAEECSFFSRSDFEKNATQRPLTKEQQDVMDAYQIEYLDILKISGFKNLENRHRVIMDILDAAYTDHMVLLYKVDNKVYRKYINHNTIWYTNKTKRQYVHQQQAFFVEAESTAEWDQAFEFKTLPDWVSSPERWRLFVGRGSTSMYQILLFTYRHLKGYDPEQMIEAPASVHRSVICGPKSIMRHVYDDSCAHVASLFAAKSGNKQHFAQIKLLGTQDAPRWTPASIGDFSLLIKLHDALPAE